VDARDRPASGGGALLKVLAHLLAADGAMPNHPRWPLLVFLQAIENPTPEGFEDLFEKNKWPPAWRNGVHPFHHYHSTAHEALGVYEGEVTVQFGGESGIAVTARAGDVIVLPAGTGHKKLSSRGSLGIVGAYPEGQDPDTCLAKVNYSKNEKRIAGVALPACDPVAGAGGPLFTYWK
jgi:uncharacterized protein YjlB